MEKALETDGVIENLNDNTKGLAKALDALEKKITTAAGQNDPKVTITADYNTVKAAVSTITTAIDDTLAAGGLTQLDTANLKAIKSSVVDLEKTFESIEGIKTANGNAYEVADKDFAKVKEAIAKISEASQEVGESATKALESSKAQAENIG